MTTDPHSNSDSRLPISASALMAIRSLELRARSVVEGFWNGLHRSPYHGFSVEFTEYRQYTPGDDPRHLDWRVFGRSDRHFIKKFEDETNLRCHLMVDRSRSMEFDSVGYSKDRYAATLAATLAYFLYLQGDAVGLITFDESVREFLPARHRMSHLRQLYYQLEKPVSGRSTDLVAPLTRVAELVRQRGLLIFVSDFLAPIEPLDRPLTELAAMGHEIAFFQILDPAEWTLGKSDAMIFEDLENGRMLYVDPVTARARYRQRMSDHQEFMRQRCAGLGIAWIPLRTDQPLETALFDFVQSRSRRSRRSVPELGTRGVTIP